MIDLIKIAHIGSTQGKSGALKLYPDENLEDVLHGLDFIFVKINGSKVPFKVNKINIDHNPWLLHINKVDGPEQAQSFINKDVYVESDKVGKQILVSDDSLKSFTIISSEGDNFGKVIDLEEHPQQILLVVEYKNNNYHLPFHLDLIQDLNKEEKKLIYNYTTENLELLFS